MENRTQTLSCRVYSRRFHCHCRHPTRLNIVLFCGRFASKVLFLLPKLHGISKTQCFEILHSRVDSIEDLFLQLKNKNIIDTIKDR